MSALAEGSGLHLVQDGERLLAKLTPVDERTQLDPDGLKVLLRGIREFFDCHDKPFLNATPISGQAHTFKSPTTRLKERFSVTVRQRLFLLVCK